MTERLYVPRGAYVPDWNWGFTAPEAEAQALAGKEAGE